MLVSPLAKWRPLSEDKCKHAPVIAKLVISILELEHVPDDVNIVEGALPSVHCCVPQCYDERVPSP